jgi:hypothetical protein
MGVTVKGILSNGWGKMEMGSEWLGQPSDSPSESERYGQRNGKMGTLTFLFLAK